MNLIENFQKKRYKWTINTEELFNFPGYKGNANQNYTKISSHPSYNGHLQEQKQEQMLARMR
jgi:hypothetical protein